MTTPPERAMSDQEPHAMADGERGSAWVQPARGIAIGILLGLFAWALIGLAVWAFVR